MCGGGGGRGGDGQSILKAHLYKQSKKGSYIGYLGVGGGRGGGGEQLLQGFPPPP